MRRLIIPVLSALLLIGGLAPAPAAAQSRGEINAEAQVFLNAFQVVRDYGIVALGDSAVWTKAVEGLIRELDDPYAAVFTPEEYGEFREENTGDYAGIGVQITQLNELITVTAVFRDTPAERIGMMVGDVILEVEGEPTTGWTTAQTSDIIRGPVGENVSIAIGRQGLSRPMNLTITRDNVHVSSVVYAELQSGVGYIQLDRFAEDSATEIEEALAALQGTKGVILDLRGNPGGLMNESIAISDLFLPAGEKVVSVASRTPGQTDLAVQEEFVAERPAIVPTKPLVILVDDFSASASEIVAGALQDHDRALLVGERSFGKGIFQQVFRLTPTRHLRLTTGEWYTPLGRSLIRQRSSDGRLIPEEGETETVTTSGGRVLSAGGGVYPDLEVNPDTLTLKERAFLSQTAEVELPLALRIEEVAFNEADERRRNGDDPYLSDATFDEFLATIEGEGASTEYTRDDEIREYLKWRINVRLGVRMDRQDASIEWRRQRDPQLDEAIKLLLDVRDQVALFEAAGERQDELSRKAEEEVPEAAGAS